MDRLPRWAWRSVVLQGKPTGSGRMSLRLRRKRAGTGGRAGKGEVGASLRWGGGGIPPLFSLGLEGGGVPPPFLPGV